MLSTKQAAEELGITQTRVRELLNSGALQGEKLGRSWAVFESSVRERRAQAPTAGRPKAGQAKNMQATPSKMKKEIAITRALYEQCKEHLTGCFDIDFLDLAQSEEERSFYTSVASFFLQQKQREMIERGVY